MDPISNRRRHPLGLRLLYGSVVLGAAATVAACGSSSSSGTAASSSGNATGGSSSAVTISAKSVPGVGAVLVNTQGQTLYMLTSEKGGKITCTASNGCTQVWPEITLPSGTAAAKAGTGVQASLLGTVKGASGSPEVTYNGWPLYTFSCDSGPGPVKGQGITSFGGTWYVLNASGSPVTAKAASSPSSGGGGYGY